MLATVLEWLTDFLTGAIMESRKAARSKAVASPPWNADIIDFEIQWSGVRPFNRECWTNFGCEIFSLSNNLVRRKCLAGHKTTGAGWVEAQLFDKIARHSWSPRKYKISNYGYFELFCVEICLVAFRNRQKRECLVKGISCLSCSRLCSSFAIHAQKP